MKSSKVVRGVAAGVLGVAALAVGARFVDAHTPMADADCHGLKVSLTRYEGPATNNTVTVTIDGDESTWSFGTSWSDEFSWSPDDAHDWSVLVDANRETGDPDRYDWSATGEQPACTPTSSSTTAPTSSTTTSSTTSTTTSSTTSTTVPTSSSSTTG